MIIKVITNRKLQIILVFLLAGIIFYLIQFSSQNILGADAYYHIKHAYLIKTQGILKTFPWLQYSVLKNQPADFSFLYHVFLIPFTSGNLAFGAKLSSVCFATLLATAFFWILKKYKIKFSFLWIILLMTGSFTFLFRILLPRPHVLSIIFLLIGFYLMTRKKYIWLFVTSAIFMLVYEVAPLIIFLSLVYITVQYLSSKHLNYKIILAPLFGIFIGLIVHPNFPTNIYINYTILFRIPVSILKGTHALLRGGGEMNPISFQNLFFSSIPLFIFFFLSTTLLAIRWIKLARQARKTNNWKKINVEMFSQQKLITITLTLLILSLLFLTLTLNSQRFVEYWAPFTLLYSAFATHLALRDKNVSWPKIKRFLLTHKPLAPALVLFFCVAIIYSGFLNVLSVTSQMKQTQPYDAYKQAAQWLEENTPQNSIVFHSDWDNFPFLFFWNNHNYYIVGMDPTFMYVYDQKKYWLWENITQKGIACDGPLQDSILTDKYSFKESKIIHDMIIKDFNSRYVFIDDHHEKFKKRLDQAPELFKKTYEDEYASVYELK